MKKSLFAAATLLAAACQQDGGGNEAAEANGSARGRPAAEAGQQAKASILESLGESAGHKSLVNAVRAAGLTETLSGAQPYTLFAPSDAAFEKLPAGMANELLAPEAKGRLVAVLTGHIVPGTVTAADLTRAIDRGKGKAEFATVGGGTLSFTRSGDAILVDGAGGQGRIVGAEKLQSNGVVHDVDGVLAGG